MQLLVTVSLNSQTGYWELSHMGVLTHNINKATCNHDIVKILWHTARTQRILKYTGPCT